MYVILEFKCDAYGGQYCTSYVMTYVFHDIMTGTRRIDDISTILILHGSQNILSLGTEIIYVLNIYVKPYAPT